jgi:NitT/TauT family transport system ATP-binding protein
VATLDRLTIRIREKRFPAVGDSPARLVLKDVTFSAAAGEFVAVTGPSGCGKTTLLNIVAGLDNEYAGEIALPMHSGETRPTVGYVFQNPRLLPWRTVLENVLLVLSGGAEARDRARELLQSVGLRESRDAYPERLSVGMGRRVALARAFAVNPDIPLMDEPYVSLDPQMAQRLRVLLVDIWSSHPTTVLFVTHDLREAIMLADRILVLPREAGPVAAEIPRDKRRDEAPVEAFRRALLDDPANGLDEVI